jgi:hypothetical protein
MLEWFRPGEHDRVDRVLDDMAALGVTELRTGISWADCCTPEGEAWFAWLLPQLARRVNVLPCFVDTPPGWGVAPKTSAPPGNLKSYADFLDVLITRHGRYFEWIELWNEPNDPRKWDAELDPYWWKFSEMIGNAAYWARHRGRRRCWAECDRSSVDAALLRNRIRTKERTSAQTAPCHRKCNSVHPSCSAVAGPKRLPRTKVMELRSIPPRRNDSRPSSLPRVTAFPAETCRRGVHGRSYRSGRLLVPGREHSGESKGLDTRSERE